jgi:hypothetical protein
MKFDFSKAYRRLQYDGISSLRCLAVFDKFAFLQLRLSFGGMGCPASWCPISEIITDLANELLANSAWDQSICQSPDQNLVPASKYLPQTIPFEPALPTMLLPPARPFGSADVYIDDIITTFVDNPSNNLRAPSAVPLAIHVVGRPTVLGEFPPREPLLSLNKLSAEGAPEETKTILGWLINTRNLTIRLPSEKFLSWQNDINDIVHNKTTVTRSSLEQLIGRLNHASQIIPLSRFFMGRLRAKIRSKSFRNTNIYFNAADRKILGLWLQFLKKAHTGINMNLLTLRQPTNIIITDACPDGMGGYSVTSGKAWRVDLRHLSIPDNNKLEFMASVVGVLQSFANDEIPRLGNVLVLTDNSSGLCWLHRNNFDPDQLPVHAEIAAKLAQTCIRNDFTIHSQHIAGVFNNVADTLSRKLDIPSDTLRNFILSSFPSQTPQNFSICDLHPDIASWIFSTLALHPSSGNRGRKRRTKAPTVHGDVGSPSFPPWESPSTHFSTDSLPPTAQPCAEHSSNPSVRELFPHPDTIPSINLSRLIRDQYSAGVSKKPLSAWLRNSDTIRGKAPFTSRTATTSSTHLSAHCFEPGKTSTK